MEIINIILGVITLGLVAKLYLNGKPRGQRGGRIVIDTSTLMDGRVIELGKTGFLTGTLIVPSSVIMEMQKLADEGSSLKRERARYGLDILKELQGISGLTVNIIGVSETEQVDDVLRELAHKYRAHLMTNDYNLAKVAAVEGIKVLNINELAQGLRPQRLPGEKLTIKIVQKGAERDQGVGYLEDGTMVVVDHAARKIGTSAEVLITRSLQTAAGKMCFAELANK